MGAQGQLDPSRADDSGLPWATARRIAAITAALLVLCVGVSLSTQSSSMTWGILVGGILVLTNFGLLCRVVEGLLTGELGAGLLISLTLGKLALTAGVLSGAAFVLDFSLYGMALGLSLIAAGIVLSPVAELFLPAPEAPHGC